MLIYASTGTKKKISYLFIFFNRVYIDTYRQIKNKISIYLFYFEKITIPNVKSNISLKQKFRMHRWIFVYLYKLYILYILKLSFRRDIILLKGAC